MNQKFTLDQLNQQTVSYESSVAKTFTDIIATLCTPMIRYHKIGNTYMAAYMFEQTAKRYARTYPRIRLYMNLYIESALNPDKQHADNTLLDKVLEHNKLIGK
jgi:hypothetical protein